MIITTGLSVEQLEAKYDAGLVRRVFEGADVVALKLGAK
jgi:hypothetical protein